MKVFVTGATGNIGAAVVNDLLAAGHTVIGLTRSEAGATKLHSQGAQSQPGTLTDLDVLRKTASSCDAVAHLAFQHEDFNKFVQACEVDRGAIKALGEGLATSSSKHKILIVTSGTMLLPGDRVTTEKDVFDATNPFGASRGASEDVALGFEDQGIRVSIVRLPPVVHGEGSHGFVRMLIGPSQITYIGKGENRWCTVNTLDAARIYRLAIEKGAERAVYHALGDESITVKEIVAAMASATGLPAVSKTDEEAKEFFGFLAYAIASDKPSSSEQTRKALSWEPTHPNVIQNIASGILKPLLQ